MRARTLSILLVASVSVAVRVAGQATATPDLRVLFLRSLQAGRALRISAHDAGTITGSFREVRDSALWLEGQPGRSVPIAGIDSLWISQGHSATGAIIGGLIGAIVGVAAVSGRTCQLGDNSCLAGGYVESAGITLAGTLFGALIGSGVKSWHLRFP